MPRFAAHHMNFRDLSILSRPSPNSSAAFWTLYFKTFSDWPEGEDGVGALVDEEETF
jgi:hypothetical protein